MRTTGDQHLVKKINKSIILGLIRIHSPLSRAKLAEVSGLNKGTVSSLVNELIEERFVDETGPGESSGGRRPVMLTFQKRAGYAVGIDLRVHELVGVLTDLEGDIITELKQPLASRKPESVLQQLLNMIQALSEQAPLSPQGVVGVGIGVPGIVDANGTVLFAPNLGWENVRLQELVSGQLNLPVTIDNEANVGALGEMRYGAGKDSRNQVYFSVGTGIGTGIILNRELFKGAYGFSGETGHMSINASGIRCTCGNIGCLELYASEQALTPASGDGTFLSAAGNALAGHEEATSELINISTSLGIGVANIINVMNPELILIGNEIIHAEPWVAEGIRQTVEARALPYHRGPVRIEFAELGDRSTVLGAASIAVEFFMTKDRVTLGH
ncbi:ROK family protein [Paenibacillus swuensis]|uniref:ROK family protein n=1 Tax=Paenibacillus swuensis TaxID=1178515 RepID=A0A172TJ77_9BACL|nr:ROK family transcriptional regulator [Paenibacillus swuensis]ANE47119.1 ROK family protein [Paenibacillus swuensis]